MKKTIITIISFLLIQAGYSGVDNNKKLGAPYMEAQAGYAQMQTGRFSETQDKIGGIGWGINIGYLFNIQDELFPKGFKVGPEIGYFKVPYNGYYSFITDEVFITHQSNVNLLARLEYDFENDITAFLKAGLSYSEYSADTSWLRIGVAEIVPTFVIGAGYPINKNISLNVSGQYTAGVSNWFKQHDPNVVPSNFAILLGLKYSFNQF